MKIQRSSVDTKSQNSTTSAENPLRNRKTETFDDYIQRTKISEKHSKRKFFGKWFFWFALIFFCASILWAIFAFAQKADMTIESISDNGEKHSFMETITQMANPRSYKTLSGFEEGRINILLLGRANTHKAGKDLTDTIMLLSVNTVDYTLSFFSLPRDLLITNGSDRMIKINALYQSGLRNDVGADYIIDAVAEVTGQKIHYYIVMDFDGFINIIDTLGGINVDVPQHIKDDKYPGPGYSYETFEVFPGLQKFDGETALKYARTRHDPEGDFGRAKRQQYVMQAAKNKAFSLGTIVNPIKIADILTTLGDHIHTDIAPNEIEPFIALTKKVDTHNITNVVVDAWKPGSLLISARYYSSTGGISGLVPRIGITNYKEIREHAKNIFNLKQVEQRAKDITNEQPSIIVINASSDTTLGHRVAHALTTIGFMQVSQETDTSIDIPRDHTIVIDRTAGEKPFSLDEIIKKVPAKKDNFDINITDTDFVIILGNDILDAYTYTVISQDEMEQDAVRMDNN
jgi:LCP family protein required for cell wall assembly